MAVVEKYLHEDPARYMSNCLIQNLGYLYELTLDKPSRERKIQVLGGVAARCRLDDMNSEKFFGGGAEGNSGK